MKYLIFAGYYIAGMLVLWRGCTAWRRSIDRRRAQRDALRRIAAEYQNELVDNGRRP